MNKALKAARLAASAEQLGNEHEAIQAGATAGRLWAATGMTLDQLDIAAGGLCRHAWAWNACVDAWYDAQEIVA